jgi:hypothetical protein
MTTKNKKQINTRKKKREEKQHCQHRPTTPSNKRRTAVFKQPNRQPSTPSSNNPFKQPHSNNPFQTTHFKQPITKTHSNNRLQKPIQTGRTAVFKQPNRQPVDTLTFYEFFRLWHFVHRCPKGCHSIFGLLRRFFFFACRRPFDR